MLASAGFPDAYGGKTFEIVTYSEEGNLLAQAIQGMLSDVGINTKISDLERGLFQQRRQDHDFDFLILSTLRVEPSQILVPYFDSKQAPYPNIVDYAGADDLIEKAVITTDPAEREKLYQDAQRQMDEDVLPCLCCIRCRSSPYSPRSRARRSAS